MESHNPTEKTGSQRPFARAPAVLWATLLLVLLLTVPVAGMRAVEDALPLTLAVSTTVQVGSATIAPGESTVVDLEVLTIPTSGLGEADIRVQYDPAVVNATACTADPGTTFDDAVCLLGALPNQVAVAVSSAAGVSGDIVLARITFQAVGSVGDTSALTLSGGVDDLDGIPMAVTLENGQIQILAAPPAPPAAPANLSATAVSPTQIELAWDDSSDDESAFHVERSPDGSTGWTEIGTVGADVMAYSDTDLTCDVPYFYRVRAYRSGDDQFSDYSNVADETPPCNPPPTPELWWPPNASSSLEAKPTFLWSPATGATSYRIEVDDSLAFDLPEVNTTTAQTIYSPVGPLPPGTYYWRVQATNAAGDTSWTSAWSFTVGAKPQPQVLVLTASPTVLAPDGFSSSALTATVQDDLGTPVADGTVVVFDTSLGSFPGGLSTTPAPSGMVTVEAEDSAVVKTGSWLPYSQFEASGGQVIYSDEVGARTAYTFIGTGVSVIVQKQYNAGLARVYVDGMLYREIDTYWDDGSGSGKLFQQEELIAGNLPYGTHQVEVAVTGMHNPASSGTFVVMDAFRTYGHDQNGAYLTSGGIATVSLTSATTPGTAAVSACAGTACDATTVQFGQDRQVYLPLILENHLVPVPSCQELIVNGGFEDDSAWVLGATPRPARYTTEQAYSGSRSMLLGFKPGEADVRSYSSVKQTITLPADAQSASISFWYYPMSGLDPGDRQECLLLDESDRVQAILMRTNSDASTWTPQLYDLSAYAGQTIRIYFNAYNDRDGAGLTGFYLDDVSVQACAEVGPPPPTPDCYPAQMATVAVGEAPHGVAANGAANRIYVANHDDDTLSVLNGATYGPLSTIAVGDGPNGVAFNPANQMIYVANSNANTVSVLRASDYGLVKTISVGSRPDGLAANPDTNKIYVANYGSGTVSVIDGATNATSQTLPVGAEPAMIAVNPATNKAYVALHGEGRVAVIDGAGTVTYANIFDSSGAYGIAVDTVRNLVYVATIDTARIVVIDGGTGTFLGWAQITRLPGGEPVPLRMIAVNPVIGGSGHLFATTTAEDGGWNRFLMLPKGWAEGFGRPYALALNEPREGLAFDPSTRRVFVTSRSDDLVAVYLDGEPTCANNFAPLRGHQLTVCVASPDGTCQKSMRW